MSKVQAAPSKLFVIFGGLRKDEPYAVLSLPELTDSDVVTAAWAYAVTFSAKGLNRPDYDAAVDLLKKRHPSWQVIGRNFTRIDLQLSKADDDVAETE